ncbi:MAG: carbon monoxide dehydrogenase [Gammaproteobacteria bacterium HGW-Gammaproteobacteria-3]|nr:MAG: carbon monoxide dehydrogenase [Gammaproteobacteria bacterium HGW-Gammaproteobacteria-3]
MIPSEFEYHAPHSVAEAITLLTQYPEEARLLAGGHSLLPMMKLRFAEPAHLIDINGIKELKGISEQGNVIRIGAMTTESELIDSALLNEKCPLIPAVARLIADPQVRNRGTIGGDIVHGDPGNDHPAVMLALDARFILQGPEGERTVPANGFFLGTYSVGMAADEILTAILVPVFASSTGYGFNKLKRKTGDFATAASSVVVQLQGESCADIRIALTNAGPCAFRAEAAEDLLKGQVITDALIEQAAQKVMAACEPDEDLRGDAEYKTHMSAEMARRSIRDALTKAKG